MNTSSTGRRLIAKTLDEMLASLFLLPIVIQGISSQIRSGEVVLEWKWIILSIFLQFSYRVFFLQILGGTPGKLLLGLRVVPSDPEKTQLLWIQSVLRVLADYLSIFFGYGLYALAFLRFDRTHVSDWIAETRVVQSHPRENPPQRRPILAVFLFVYFSISGFTSIYKFYQNCTWDRNQLRIENLFPTED